MAEDGLITRLYRRFLTGAMRARWLTIAVTIAAFVISVMALGIVPRQFFPPSDRVELLVDLRLPQNASIHATASVVDRFDTLLKEDPDIERWSTYVGRGAIRFYLPLNVQLANPFFGQSVIVARSIEARERLQARLEKLLPQEVPGIVCAGFPAGTRTAGGMAAAVPCQRPRSERGARDRAPAGADRGDGSGDATDQLRLDGARARTAHPVDQDEARRLGLSSAAMAPVLNAAMTGTTVTQVRDVIYLIDVLARAQGGQSLSVSSLRTLPVPLPNGRTIPLNQLATFEYGQDYPLVWRRDRLPTLTVQSDVAPGVLPEAVVDELTPAIAALNASLPASYRITVGGIAEESARVTSVGLRRRAADAVFDAQLSDDPVEELPTHADRRERGSARTDRRRGGTAGLGQASGICRDPRHPLADRDDRAQRGDPDRADRGRAGRGQGGMGCGHRGEACRAFGQSC